MVRQTPLNKQIWGTEVAFQWEEAMPLGILTGVKFMLALSPSK